MSVHKNVSNGRLISIIVVIAMMITIATEIPACEHNFSAFVAFVFSPTEIYNAYWMQLSK